MNILVGRCVVCLSYREKYRDLGVIIWFLGIGCGIG